MSIKRQFTQDELRELLEPSPSFQANSPTLYQIEEGLQLIHKRYRYDVWRLRKDLKRFVRLMDKHYEVQWDNPWFHWKKKPYKGAKK
jgi:hypothetical protein